MVERAHESLEDKSKPHAKVNSKELWNSMTLINEMMYTQSLICNETYICINLILLSLPSVHIPPEL